MFLGFLLSVTPPNLKAKSKAWLQMQFEEDMFSINPKRPGLAFVYGALNPRTGEFRPEYRKNIAAKGLDRQLRADQSGVVGLRRDFSFQKMNGINPFILNTGTKYKPKKPDILPLSAKALNL